MSDYQRLVSYIYSYPGGTRDKNVGFAKAEVRNGQFKLNVSLKGVYTDAPETFGVHLLIEDKEKPDGIVLFPVGNVIVNGGAGQYADLLNPSNISGSGYRFEDVSGIAVAKESNDYYRMFSLWKDMQIKPELVRFLPKDYKKSEITERDNRTEEIVRDRRFEQSERAEKVENAEINERIAGEEKITRDEEITRDEREVKSRKVDNIKTVTTSDGDSPISEERGVQSAAASESTFERTADLQAYGKSSDVAQASESQKPVPGEMGGIFDNADFIDVFGDDYYYDCVEVTPEQLQKLPIEDKAVISNSFLEHGYYNFKHLLFGRVRENERHTKYFIGVPGMYCNRERFMATMFGYGNFKRSHRADCSNPYFGYWYQEI